MDELALLWQHEEEDELQVHALKTAKVRHTCHATPSQATQNAERAQDQSTRLVMVGLNS